LNPYATPKAKLEEVVAEGTAWRDGNLVRVDRSAGLPARCVACNLPADRHIRRRLYCSPLAWRLGAFAAPFALLALGALFEAPLLMVLFWPSIIVLLVAHVFVRSKFVLEAPVCSRHARMRVALQVLSFASIGAAVALPFALGNTALMIKALWACIAAIVVLAVVQSIAGVQALRLKRLTADHAWLGGAGRDFRQGLPEIPG
jgi:hypothetical protein